MSATILLIALVLLVGGSTLLFLRTSPAGLARGLRLAGPVMLALAGGGLLLAGRAAIGGMLISGALAWYARSRARSATRRTAGQRSSVRTAALEMELDHDSGGLEGVVLAGRHEGCVLGEMSEAEVVDLLTEFRSDGESVALLETYLDGRFPGWRQDTHADRDPGEGMAPRAGAMTKQEAYDILGLEAGADAAEIRKAHRRLMQRMHPDVGGSSFLAARINEAKDILLSDHG